MIEFHNLIFIILISQATLEFLYVLMEFLEWIEEWIPNKTKRMQGHRREELEDYLFLHKIEDSHWTTTCSVDPRKMLQECADWTVENSPRIDKESREWHYAIRVNMIEFPKFTDLTLRELLEAEEIQFSTVIRLFEEYKRKKGL